MNISFEEIKKLREVSGAGVSDCKTALEEAGGDIEKAIVILRKKGIARAAKRSERQAGEGVVKVWLNREANQGYIIEFNAETDFVVRSEKFQQFMARAEALIKDNLPADKEQLLAAKLDGATVEDFLANLSGIIGEKLDIRNYQTLKTNGTLAAYSHLGGRIGVLVSIDQAKASPLAQEIAMQVAAANPKYIKPEDVPAEELDKEKEIYIEQLKKEGKTEEMINKIIPAKLNKYFEEVCLNKQEYIKDDKKKVEDILGRAKVEKFIRYSI